jgi:hypothetical protein
MATDNEERTHDQRLFKWIHLIGYREIYCVATFDRDSIADGIDPCRRSYR